MPFEPFLVFDGLLDFVAGAVGGGYRVGRLQSGGYDRSYRGGVLGFYVRD
jgi:hypothetical protein